MRMRCLRDHGHMAWEGSMIGDGAKAVTVAVNNVTHIVERTLQVEVYYPTPLVLSTITSWCFQVVASTPPRNLWLLLSPSC